MRSFGPARLVASFRSAYWDEQFSKRNPRFSGNGGFFCRERASIVPQEGLPGCNRPGEFVQAEDMSFRAEGVGISWQCISNSYIVPGDCHAALRLAMTAVVGSRCFCPTHAVIVVGRRGHASALRREKKKARRRCLRALVWNYQTWIQYAERKLATGRGAQRSLFD